MKIYSPDKDIKSTLLIRMNKRCVGNCRGAKDVKTRESRNWQDNSRNGLRENKRDLNKQKTTKKKKEKRKSDSQTDSVKIRSDEGEKDCEGEILRR